MDENKSLPLHVTGILIYRIQRQVEFLFLNDTFSHKKHWTAPKGTVIRQEDEVKCALRNTIEITGLSVKDLRIEEDFRAEITYLSGTRPKRVVYYLAQVSDHARVYTTGEGLNIAWLSINNAMEKALYKSMQDVIKKATIFIENNKPPKNTESLQRSRIDKHQITGDRLDHKMKNLNLALPLDSQRQAMSEQRLKLVRKQQRQNQNQSEKNSGIVNGNGNNGGNGPNNGFASPLHSPVMQFENPLYKTRLCERFETEGYCPYGPKCTFAHGTVELRERPANAEEKIDTPPTAKDGPDNPLYKTRLCERFMKESFCQYGPKCNFAHGEHELRDRPNNPATSNPRGGDNGGERQSPEPHPRLNGSNNIEPERRTVPVSPGIGGGFRSEIQNGILGRIPIIANSDSHSKVHNSAHVEESKPETLEEDKKVERFPEENREEDEHESKEKHNESKENDEHRELKDSKDLSVTPSTVSCKPISGSKRRSGKDIISVDEKPWMQVVELSNVELEQLGKIKKVDHAPSSDSKRSHDDIIIADLKKFFVQSREQNKSISDEIKEITLIETRKDLSKFQLFNVLLPSMYDDISWDVVNKDLVQKEKLFKTFIRGSQDQVTFLRSWEKYLNTRNVKLLSKAALLFKSFYDKDYVEEDSVLEWYNQAKDTSDVKKRCAVFVEWLKNAEEED
ncbi:6132_t:CDS:2 [Funneliformis geosporum]|uniref:18076_t:CDS:1 n=1 Tax=Funneliformis geosporum TaxID=1117311 RepID=A0A9W4ST65_9GLOM|nr:6132_t:CDS:2 [Funneliformis geosporum]CAI2179675.1 18076_t:CDS:2 [Funneliformis geosporum]